MVYDQSYIEQQKPKISVIMPIYNARKHLKNSIESILKQSFDAFELLCIDDGSTDGSGEVCLSYAEKDNRIRYIRKENGGAYQTRLYGAEKANGDYILFCDADDFYSSKDAFFILYKTAITTKCQCIQFGHYKKFNHLKKKYSTKQNRILNEKEFVTAEYPALLCNNWHATLTGTIWDKMYHKQLFSNLPKAVDAERIFWGDDIITNLHLLRNCSSFVFLPQILYTYQEFTGSTNSFSERTMLDLNNIKKYQLKFLDSIDFVEKNKVREGLFAECAFWLYLWAQDGLSQIEEKRLINILEDALHLPCFILTRKYFLEEQPQQSWTAVELLRKSDPEEYIATAKKSQPAKSRNIKKILVTLLKKI